MSRGRVVLLTGPSRAGKTTVCREVTRQALARGLRVAGVLTEDGVAPGGIALQLVRDLQTAEQRLLATASDDTAAHNGAAAPAVRRSHGSAPGEGTPRLRWAFDADGVAFGRQVLSDAMADDCDLLVIDQIGPFELRQGRGWTIAFDVLECGRFGLALVVVNPRVLDEVRRRVDGCDVLEVDDTTRDELPADLVATCLPAE